MDHDIPAPTARQVLPSRSLPPGIRRFLDTEAASGLALIAAAVAAMVRANSPWSHSYVWRGWSRPCRSAMQARALGSRRASGSSP
jgi:hypothetical protein